jgi:hypothetical protein
MSSYEVEESANGTKLYQRHKHKSQQTTTANYNWLDANY